MDELKPVVASAVKASLLEHPIQAVASVDRMYNIVKEYGILKPAIMHHRNFRDFMKSLDEVLNEDDIDDVLKRLEDSDKKSK